MVCLHQYTEFCAALDTHKRPCGAKTRAGLPWCPRHNEERIKLYFNYKTHHAALSAFDQNSICMNTRKVRACTSIERLRRWNKTLVYKYRLITRCIEARAYFTERFFGNDMDFGHKHFWKALLRQQFDVERILAQVEQRAYELILASQNALWVLKQPSDPSQSTLDCDGFDDDDSSGSSDTDCSAKTTTSESLGQENIDTFNGDVEDPLEVALREKAAALREKISMRLARYCAPADSKFYGERMEVINALVRRAVYTDPSLMVASQNHDSVLSFIRDSSLPVAIISKLWTSLKELFTDEATGAVDDVLRPQDSNADYVEVLGGRVYKSRSGLEWPFHAWGHFTSIIRCYSCLRKMCSSVDDIMALTRFAILTRIPLHQSTLKCYHAVEKSGILTLCGSLINSLEGAQFFSRFSIEKYNASDGKPQWSETESNIAVCMGLSLNDPKSEAFAKACAEEPDFMVLYRPGRDAEVIRSVPRIWAKRIRRASTRAGLKKAPWDDVRSTLYFRDSLLQECFPMISPPRTVEDCFQLAVIDAKEDNITDVVAKLAKVWMKVYKTDCIHELCDAVAMPYVDSGELEMVKEHSPCDGTSGCCKVNPFLPGTESDILLSYKRLWETTPSSVVFDD